MEKLINKFEDIVREYYWFYCSKTPELDGTILFQPEMIPLSSSKPCAEETKKIAIEFAKKFNIDRSAISKIRRQINWKHRA